MPQGLGAALVIIGLVVTVYGQQKEAAQVDEGKRKYSDSDFGSIDTDPFLNGQSYNQGRDNIDENSSSGLLSEGNLSALNAQFIHNPTATTIGASINDHRTGIAVGSGVDVRKSRDTEEGTEKTIAWKTSPGRKAINRL